MKTLILFEDGRTQLVLKPESDHDKAVCDQIATLPNTYRADFRHGQGYSWNAYEESIYGRVNPNRDNDVVLVLNHQKPTEPPA